MTEEEEGAAEQWWNDLRERSLGTCHVYEWCHIWTSVMLRRVKPEASLYRFRSLDSWERLINQQISPDDPEGPNYENQTYDFFHRPDSPWAILHRPSRRDDYGIGRVPTLDQDIEFARGLQSKRMAEENRLRLEADRKRMSLQLEKNRPHSLIAASPAGEQASSVPTAPPLSAKAIAGPRASKKKRHPGVN
jgi:hypothetical protein